MAAPADEDAQNKRAALLAELREIKAGALAMADEARAAVALLDRITLP